MGTTREIIVDDSMNYLEKVNSLANVITGLPDLDETDMTMSQYAKFFNDIVSKIFEKLNRLGYAIFIQTDRKYQGSWLDKSYMLSNIALSFGCKMVWHKIVLQREVGRINLHRPGYSHMVCYTYDGKPGVAFADVVPVSTKLYKNGTPIGAANAAVNFIKQNNKGDTTIVDPFVGKGTIVAIANNYGLNAIGIDIDPKQAALAQTAIINS